MLSIKHYLQYQLTKTHSKDHHGAAHHTIMNLLARHRGGRQLDADSDLEANFSVGL